MILQEDKVAMGTVSNKIRISDRVEDLRKRLISKGFTGGEYAPKVRLCLERARFFTESYRSTEGEPPSIRRAKALEHTLANMTIFIKDSELIVGYDASAPNKVSCCPETALDALKEGLTPEGSKYVDVEALKELRKIIEYWQDKCLRTYVEGDPTLRRGEGKKMLDVALANCTTSSTSWTGGLSGSGKVAPPDYEFVLKHGLNEIINMIENRIELEEERLPKSGPEDIEALEKFHEWEAMIIT